MNLHNQSNDVFDSSLRRSLKNWANRKKMPVEARSQLLAAAAQQERSLAQSKPSKFSFVWLLIFQGNQEVLNIRPSYACTVEGICLLKANMAIL